MAGPTFAYPIQPTYAYTNPPTFTYLTPGAPGSYPPTGQPFTTYPTAQPIPPRPIVPVAHPNSRNIGIHLGNTPRGRLNQVDPRNLSKDFEAAKTVNTGDASTRKSYPSNRNQIVRPPNNLEGPQLREGQGESWTRLNPEDQREPSGKAHSFHPRERQPSVQGNESEQPPRHRSRSRQNRDRQPSEQNDERERPPRHKSPSRRHQERSQPRGRDRSRHARGRRERKLLPTPEKSLNMKQVEELIQTRLTAKMVELESQQAGTYARPTGIKDGPLTSNIYKASMNDFKYPSALPTFQGSGDTQDPHNFVCGFMVRLRLLGATDVIMCRIFTTCLAGEAWDWYISLLRDSIRKFEDFVKVFLERYTIIKPPWATCEMLLDITQGPKERTGNFVNQFI